MAKKAKTKQPKAPESAIETAMVGFAEDLGRILGTTQAKAESWLNQRKQISQQLAQIRDTANKYLHQLTGGGANKAVAVPQGRRGRPPGSKNKKVTGASINLPDATFSSRMKGKRKRFKMSAEAREKIAAAQRARWAKQKRSRQS